MKFLPNDANNIYSLQETIESAAKLLSLKRLNPFYIRVSDLDSLTTFQLDTRLARSFIVKSSSSIVPVIEDQGEYYRDTQDQYNNNLLF